MEILGIVSKQVAETQDYDLDFSPWLAGLGDTGLSFLGSVTPAGVTMLGQTRSDGVVKTWLAGGVPGQTYVVQVKLTTAGGRVRESGFAVSVGA